MEQKLKLLIGELHFQLVASQALLEEANEKIKTLEGTSKEEKSLKPKLS